MVMPATVPVFGEAGDPNKSPYVGMPEDFMAYLFNSPSPSMRAEMLEAEEALREASVEVEADRKSPQGQAGVQFGDQQFNLGAQSSKQQALPNLFARAAMISEQQRTAVATQAEKEARDKPEEEARLTHELNDEIKALAEELKRGRHLDRWRLICSSCGSEDQDRRKGPVCSNCSYLVGDGDGFATYPPEQRQTQNDEIVTEEQLQEQLQGSPEHQVASTSLERTTQAEHQSGSKHAEQSVPDSTTNNHRNAPNSGAKYVPRELSFLEPSFGIDSHTAALKRKLNPVRLSTPADRPLSGLDSNDPPVLPPIQLGNAKGTHTTIPSLNEDNSLVDGLREVDRDWSLITDLAEQRRRANRMAQRAYQAEETPGGP
ncbi:hypothetical protein NW759_012934 [Fusarium solani]|nr:hypothetical protein NW759_012934 [Fusarium solani]